MIIALVSMSSSAEKRTEVSQTLAALAPLIRTEDGCARCNLYQESEDGTSFVLAEEWHSRAAFDEHVRSRVFGILLGMGSLLQKQIEITLSTLVSKEGTEAVKKARSTAGVR
jgi:quinol monooxygenase YgiN